MSLQNLNACFLNAQAECDSLLSHVDGGVSSQFMEAYSAKVEHDSSFCSYKKAKWLGNSGVVEFITDRTNKRIFFPSVGFLIASKLVPYYQELLKYRQSVIQILDDNGTNLDEQEDSNGNVSPTALGYVDASHRVSTEEKGWLKKFLSETKKTPSQWWGKGKEIKRTNDFFVSPLMKAARLNAETQNEIAEVAKQLSENPDLLALLVAGSASVNGPCEMPMTSVDRLGAALKMFAEKRKEEEWCSDKTDGDANKPRAGYVVNKMRRGGVPMATPAVTLLQHGTAAQIRDWFKSANDPNSLKSVVDAVDDGDIVTFGPYLAHLIQPQVPAPARPAKFTRALESVASNMIAPDKFGVYDENAHKALSFLGLIDFPFSKDFTDLDYDDILHAQRVIMRRLVEMKTPQVMEFGKAYSPSDPDWKDADYLTVYEFLWFVNEYKDTISKECEAKMMKKADYSQATSKPAGKKPKVDFGNAEDVVLLRLAAALRAKPFAILAGHSGTGKSRMVRKLAYMTCARGGYKALLEGADGKPAATPGNFCMVQVKPNWHDSTDLLGYYSEIGSAFRTTDFVKFICKAYAYPDVPFFVCLDEMNLAPVEQYFAEYLSAIESRKVKDDAEFLDGNGDEKTGPKVITDTLLDKSVWKSASDLGCEFTQSAYWVEKHGLTIPRNLFVVGTVNMDESTNQFSRKVLDRAFTLEMTDADFEHFGEQSPEPSYDDYAGDDFVKELLAGRLFASDLTADHKLKPTQVTNLNKLKPILADTSFVVAYRFANEYALYEDALEKMLSQFDSSTGAGGASAGTSAGAAEAPAADGATQPATGAEGAAQPAAADGTQQPGAEGTENSQGAASPSTKPEAFDDMILMKLLPRITGDAELVLKIFTGDESAKLDDANVKGLAGLLEKKGASFKKMKEIVKRGGTSLTFWP